MTKCTTTNWLLYIALAFEYQMHVAVVGCFIAISVTTTK